MSSFGDLPAECLALIYGQLDPRSKACLFASSHVTRRAVLLCARRVLMLLAKKTGAQLRTLGKLLELPARQPGQAFHLKMQGNPGQLLQHIGGFQNLHLEVTQVDSADCEAVAAACSQAHSLTLQGAHVSSPALFPQLASSCTQLRSLTLSGLTWTSPDVAASLAALGTGLPALQELVATNMSADLCAHTSLCARLTAVQVARKAGGDGKVDASWARAIVEAPQLFPALKHLALGSGLEREAAQVLLTALPSLTYLEVYGIVVNRKEEPLVDIQLPSSLRTVMLLDQPVCSLKKLEFLKQVPDVRLKALNVFADMALDWDDAGWLEDVTDAYRDPATGQLREGWPPLEIHRSLPLLTVCNLHGPAPDGPSAYSRCVTLNYVDRWDLHTPVQEASARLVAEKIRELGLANARLDPDYDTEGPRIDLIPGLGRACGRHLTGLVLHESCEVNEPEAAWAQLLSQLPKLRVVHLEGRAHIHQQAPHLVAACESAQRHIQLEVHSDQVTEEEGEGLAGGSLWVKVVRVKRVPCW